MSQKKNKSKNKNRKWKSGLKAGCLALGLATAWGGEAKAETLFEVSITPSTTLNNAYLYYGSNTSGNLMTSLGTLLAGETKTIIQTHWANPEDFVSPEGYSQPAYALIGLYGDTSNPGIAISFPNDDLIQQHKTWADVFETTGVPAWDDSKEEVLYDFERAIGGFDGYLSTFISYKGGRDSTLCGTDYGQTGTIVCFSEATYGGTITVNMVPEPASWVLLIGAAGSLLFWRRDLLGG
jgi:hypothetical protein